MRLLTISLLVATTAACTTTQRSEVKETANTVEDRSRAAGAAAKEGAEETWDRATAMPPEEREKRTFQAQHEAHMKQVSAEVDGLEERAEVNDVDDEPDFERAVDRFEDAERAAADSLAELRGSEVSAWKTKRAAVEAAMKRLDEAAGNLRALAQKTAH